MNDKKRLSESIADDILTMITIEKRFADGDKLPNENDLSKELNVSRTTLREAIRILATNGILEIRRGKGTYVTYNVEKEKSIGFENLLEAKIDAKDLFEMRLIFEPEAAYLVAKRATDMELKRIINYGMMVEEKIQKNLDRTVEEQAFHKAIAKGTHNEFMNKLMPIIYKAIDKGVKLSQTNKQALKDTLNDHRMIMEFLETRNAEGAKSAMKIHILHAMNELGLM